MTVKSWLKQRRNRRLERLRGERIRRRHLPRPAAHRAWRRVVESGRLLLEWRRSAARLHPGCAGA